MSTSDEDATDSDASFNPYEPLQPSAHSVDAVDEVGVEFSLTQKHKIRSMILNKANPKKLELYLESCGLSPVQILALYKRINIRRKDLVFRFRNRVAAQVCGVLVIMAAVEIFVSTFGDFDGLPIAMVLVGLGLLLLQSGSFTLNHSPDYMQPRLRRI
jgi:hypothetical protein